MSESIDDYQSVNSTGSSISSHSYSLHRQSSGTRTSETNYDNEPSVLVRDVETAFTRAPTVARENPSLEDISIQLAELRLQVVALHTILERTVPRELFGDPRSPHQANQEPNPPRNSSSRHAINSARRIESENGRGLH